MIYIPLNQLSQKKIYTPTLNGMLEILLGGSRGSKTPGRMKGVWLEKSCYLLGEEDDIFFPE